MSKDLEHNLIEAIPFEALVESNKAGLFYLENDIIIYANKTFADILGETKAQLLGTSIFNFVADSDLQDLKKGVELMIAGKENSYSRELRFKVERPDFKYFSIHLNTQSKCEAGIRISGASSNSTVRVTKFEKLIQTTTLFDSLYNNIKDGIVVYDYVKEKIVRANQAAIDIFGYEDEDDIKKGNRFHFVPKTSPIFPGVDCHAATKDHGIRVRNGEAFKTPGVFVKKNGEHMIVHTNVVPTFQNEGEAFIIFQDSTKRILEKKAQKEAQKKYREIFENSHEAIVYTSFKTKTMIVCNDNALKLLGGSSIDELQKISPRRFFEPGSVKGLNPISIYISKLTEAIEKGRAELSFWLKKLTGEIIQVNAVAISDMSNPKDPKVITFMRDVTNLYKTRVSLNTKNEELEKYIESNLQLENFAYFASHDLQTPLRTMVSFTQLLQRSLGDSMSEREKEYMDLIISSSRNMHDLVNDLLSFSKVNTSKLERTSFNPEKLLQMLMTEMILDINEKNAVISYSNLPEIIFADFSKMRQIFQNLITNALKFSTPNTKPIINIGLDNEDQSYWTFYVKDNGIGIDSLYKEKIFLMFKRLHTKYEFDGTGIGLALVKKIVEQHKGKIWLDSELGKGSTFFFSLKK